MALTAALPTNAEQRISITPCIDHPRPLIPGITCSLLDDVAWIDWPRTAPLKNSDRRKLRSRLEAQYSTLRPDDLVPDGIQSARFVTNSGEHGVRAAISEIIKSISTPASATDSIHCRWRAAVVQSRARWRFRGRRRLTDRYARPRPEAPCSNWGRGRQSIL